MKAIALLEVQAMVAAITGLDAMVKAADVKLIHVEKRLGGRLVTVVVEGEVSAVKAALEAGAKFIVSPGLSVEVAKICEEAGVPYLPGCVTPPRSCRHWSWALPPSSSSPPTYTAVSRLSRHCVLPSLRYASCPPAALTSPTSTSSSNSIRSQPSAAAL